MKEKISENKLRELIVELTENPDNTELFGACYVALKLFITSIVFKTYTRQIRSLQHDVIIHDTTTMLLFRIIDKNVGKEIKKNKKFPVGAYVKKCIYGEIIKAKNSNSLEKELEKEFNQDISKEFNFELDNTEMVKSVICHLKRFFPNEKISKYLPKAINVLVNDKDISNICDDDEFKLFFIVFDYAIKIVKDQNTVCGFYINPRKLNDIIENYVGSKSMRKILTDKVDKKLTSTLAMSSLIRLSRLYGGTEVRIPRYSELNEIMSRSLGLSHYLFSDNTTSKASRSSANRFLFDEEGSQCCKSMEPSLNKQIKSFVDEIPVDEYLDQISNVLVDMMEKMAINVYEHINTKNVEVSLETISELSKLVDKISKSSAKVMSIKLGG